MTAFMSPQPFVQRKRLLIVQLLSAAALVALLFTRPGWNETSFLHESLEAAGLLLILLCMFGRLWSTLYVGARKNSELVTAGPYSITRNPLYLFSTIGVFGIGLVFGSIMVAAVFGGLSYLVFSVTAQKEANFLRARFTPEFLAYESRTPQFWPDFRLYHHPRRMTFSPDALKRTFGDALYFLAIFPIVEGVEFLQTGGYLPTILRLP